MTKIKFGTDGWRAIIAQEFTTDNVIRVTEGVISWLKEKFEKPSVVVGHDCRFAGPLFRDAIITTLRNHGVKVYYADGFVSTPMISMAAKEFNASLGIIITASHNPHTYNGYKLKGNFGGPLLPADISDIESRIPDYPSSNQIKTTAESGECIKVDLEAMYIKRLYDNFDIELIKKSGIKFGFEAMYGAGQNVMRKIFPEIYLSHCEHNPNFGGIAPEPILRNLKEFSEYIKTSGTVDCGLAVDGDADRIGLFDAKGNFIDSHHIILLLIHYLKVYKGMNGKVILAFSVTDKVKKLCDKLEIPHHTVQIGFKHIAGYFLEEDILLGGEESGGIAVKGHIPERDGIWMGLIIWEYMAKTGKSLTQLIDEVYQIVGEFKYDRADLHLTDEQKNKIMSNCAADAYKSFAGRNIIRKETIDGFKYHFNNEEWLMIRASGTEPVVRVYAESRNQEMVTEFLTAVTTELLA